MKRAVHLAIDCLTKAGHSCELYHAYDSNKVTDFYFKFVTADDLRNVFPWLDNDIIDDCMASLVQGGRLPYWFRCLIRPIVKFISPVTYRAMESGCFQSYQLQRLMTELDIYTEKVLQDWENKGRDF